MKKLTKLNGAFYHLSQFINKEFINQVYYAYIFPQIKYGIEVYGTSGKTLMSRLQIQQNKLLKILSRKQQRYSSTLLHSELGLLTCLNIHNLFVLIFVHKQRYNLLPDIFQQYYKLNRDTRNINTRQINDLYVPKMRTNTGVLALKCHGAKLWNNLDEEVKNVPSKFKFKRKVKEYLFMCQNIWYNNG